MRTPLMLALSVCLASIVWGRTPPAFIHEGPGAIDEQTTIVATPPQPFRIAILPDRTTGRDWGLPYLKSAVADLNRMQPDAVFTVGDMVAEEGEALAAAGLDQPPHEEPVDGPGRLFPAHERLELGAI